MHPYPRHLATFDYVGRQRYFLTFCTHQRQRLFTRADRVALVEEHFLRTCAEYSFADLAHCFMPDHVHALVEGLTRDADLKRLIARSKQFSGFHFKKQFGVSLWQRYGFERVLRDDEATEEVIRYILANPIRAGLVHSACDYPFIGSSAYSIKELLDFCVG